MLDIHTTVSARAVQLLSEANLTQCGCPARESGEYILERWFGKISATTRAKLDILRECQTDETPTPSSTPHTARRRLPRQICRPLYFREAPLRRRNRAK